MNKLFFVIILFILNACINFKHIDTKNIKVSSHVLNIVAEIHVDINKSNTIINLQNASSAEQI